MDSTDAALNRSSFPNGLTGVVFDMDGVLFDSRASNMAYYNRVRQAVALPPLSAEEEDFCHMASVRESIDHIIPEALRPDALNACRNIDYIKEILPMVQLEPDLVETLAWLDAKDISLGIFTNRSTSVLELLQYFSIDPWFSIIRTASTGRPKPYPDGLLDILREWDVPPGQIAFIGDSTVDAMAASAAGVPFWAFRNPDLKADRHFTSFSRLKASLSPLVEEA